MITLTILGSESLGNCYILDSGTSVLIIEAGIRWQLVKQALGYDLTRVAGCIVTHRHGDHFKFARDYAGGGINIYSSSATMQGFSPPHRAYVFKPNHRYMVGEYSVIPFAVPHDVPTFGYVIDHPACGRVLFVTDASYIPGSFGKINHLMIEANYSDEDKQNDRAIGRHMALDTCVDLIRQFNTTATYNVILLHLSASNSNADRFRDTIQSIVPAAGVHIADKGLQVNLSNNPY